MNKLILCFFLFCLSFASKAQSKPDTTLLRHEREEKEWERKKADTANYYQKDVSPPNLGIYMTQTLPVRDTVACFFECIIGDPIPGQLINTKWIYGYAVRKRERIIFFTYNKLIIKLDKVVAYQITKNK